MSGATGRRVPAWDGRPAASASLTAGGATVNRMALASRKFWLDGGYDRDLAESCRTHPLHSWWTFWLSDVLEPFAFGDDEQLTICRICFVPRCGYIADEPDRCYLARHHLGAHHCPSGRRNRIWTPSGG